MNYFLWPTSKTNRSSKVWYTIGCGNIIILAIDGTSKPKLSPPIDAWLWTAYIDSFCCTLVTRQDYWPSCWMCLNYMQGELEGFISSSELLIIFVGKRWLTEKRNPGSHINQAVSGSSIAKQAGDKGGARGGSVCASPGGEWLYQLFLPPSWD